GIAFGTSATVFRNLKINEYIGTYSEEKKVDVIDNEPNEFQVSNIRKNNIFSNSLKKIPGNPIAYWASEKILEVFSDFESLENYVEPIEGIKTGHDNMFLRYWFEVANNKISKLDIFDASLHKWTYITKG